MFTIGIISYSSGISWNISTAVYSNKSFSFNSQDSATAVALTFSSDGTSMYAVGNTTHYVYQYNLSTAWDASTASYASKSFYLGSQGTGCQGVTFSTDGTKMYMLNRNLATMITYQYNLSTAWDVSTASYASKYYDSGSQDDNSYLSLFSTDGTKMYVNGFTNKKIYQYNLSTAWDVSTASYASKSLLTSSEETYPIGFCFGKDGTKIYTIGFTSGIIYQYNLSTAWDVSTASYSSNMFSVVTQDNTPYNLFIAPTGTHLYVQGHANNKVFQYTLS
jgi:hypothetical protein